MIGEDFQPTRQVRNHVVLFGAAFNNVYIWRKNDRKIKVPLSFANKERFFVKINSDLNSQDPQDNTTTNVENVLPRMSFNITGMDYAPEHKTPTQNYKFLENTQGDTIAQFVPAPWTINFQLSSYVRYEAEQLKIFEQIAPFFQPHITMIMETALEEPVVNNQHIHLTLDSVQPDESIYGGMEERRALVWNYNFTMKPVYIYPPSFGGVSQIQKIILDFGLIPPQDINGDTVTDIEQTIIETGV